jgi:plastocyanin
MLMSSKYILIIVILALIVLGGVVYLTNNQSANESNLNMENNQMVNGNQEDKNQMTDDSAMEESDDSAMEENMEGENTSTDNSAMMQEVKEFNVSGVNFKFSFDEIRVKLGDKVRINFTSQDGFHDWVLDEFGVATKRLQTGQSDSVEFVADKAGEYEYYCSVDEHRQKGMVGKLIVEE